MRLLITTDTVGGVWTYTRELSEGLLARGHDVLLVSMGRLPSRDQSAWATRATLRWPQAFYYCATDHTLEWMQDNATCYSEARPLLMEHIANFAPDLLHLNQYCYGALPTSIPKVVIAHSDVMSWSECCRGGLPADSVWLRRYLQLVRTGIANASAIVAPTQWMLDALARNYSMPARSMVIANGRSLPAKRKAGPRKLQAVTIGRVWDEGKNVRLLEEVDSPMPLLVGGELALEAEPAFASSHLHLLGQLTEDAALTLFAESSIYIATSRYEPFGLAPVEAALSGCAIVAHDIASLREVWGSSALYFRTAGELTQHLRLLHADPKLLARSAATACARARRLFSRESMIDEYLQLYASLGAGISHDALTGVRPLAASQHVS
jgi:glycosyltransferase involved in cell wall biosynthesis